MDDYWKIPKREHGTLGLRKYICGLSNRIFYSTTRKDSMISDTVRKKHGCCQVVENKSVDRGDNELKRPKNNRSPAEDGIKASR